ncbi:GntR family transcriptional regulator [Clostridium gasigenes]|uniref:GntR family transcriptional regulator n=1 Tax=Clostridium gasigenes TaxID=94869 RepID=UPI001C0C5582|nr:GntR family transcriptional regulator [Clostridium gasigenes]MBU3137837.1 GntR family transcriptional regulator [Clostridium gasigenes]
MKLDYSKGASPLYYQIKGFLEKKIIDEEYSQGDILPSELELQETFNVSRITVRQAINDLVNEGYLLKTRGKGTSVIFNKIEEPLSRIMSFTEEMRMKGLEPSTKFIKIDIVKSNKLIAKKINITEGEEVYKIERLRYVNNQPMVLFITYLKRELNLSLDIDQYTGSLYELLNEKNGIVVSKTKEYFEAVAVDKDIRGHLKIEEGTPVLKRTRISFDSNGNNLEYTICYYRADKYRYLVEIG